MRRRWYATQPAPETAVVLGARRAYAEVLLVFGVFFAGGVAAAAFSAAGVQLPAPSSAWSVVVPQSITQVATTITCIALPVLLVQRRGRSAACLGLDRAQSRSLGASQNFRIAGWALLALLVGGGVMGALATGQFPVGRFSYPALTLNLFHALQAGPLEEIVVLAFVVSTLEQACRPRPEIVAVALLLRVSYHIYYGPGAVGVFIWAGIFLWLFLRFRTILPLIVVHSSWDVIAISVHYRPILALLAVLIWLGVLITCFILWLVYRSGCNDPAGPAGGWPVARMPWPPPMGAGRPPPSWPPPPGRPPPPGPPVGLGAPAPAPILEPLRQDRLSQPYGHPPPPEFRPEAR